MTRRPIRIDERRRLRLAVLVALGVHALALAFLRLPGGPGTDPGGPLALVPQPVAVGRASDRRPEAPAEPERAAGEEGSGPGAPAPPAAAPTAVPAIRPSPAAAEEATIPSTAMIELRAAPLPLVPTGTGVGRRRIERTPEEIAHARAESLLFARMADIAVAERRDVGAVGLANGGITLAIPWQGFLPANRSDAEWRRERCAGGGGDDDDKAGEAEARRAAC